VDYKLEGEQSRNFTTLITYILFATLEAELKELVDRLDRVSHKYSLLIYVDKTKVIMASDCDERVNQNDRGQR